MADPVRLTAPDAHTNTHRETDRQIEKDNMCIFEKQISEALDVHTHVVGSPNEILENVVTDPVRPLHQLRGTHTCSVCVCVCVCARARVYSVVRPVCGVMCYVCAAADQPL